MSGEEQAEPYAWNAASCRGLGKAGFLLKGWARASTIKDSPIIDHLLYAEVGI